MAKNLKLNIKNTQLAEALKLGKIKKPAPATKAKKAASSEKEALPPQEAPLEAPLVAPSESAPAPAKKTAKKKVQPAEKTPEELPPQKQAAEVVPPAPPVVHEKKEEPLPSPPAPVDASVRSPQAPARQETPPQRPTTSRPPFPQRSGEPFRRPMPISGTSYPPRPPMGGRPGMGRPMPGGSRPPYPPGGYSSGPGGGGRPYSPGAPRPQGFPPGPPRGPGFVRDSRPEQRRPFVSREIPRGPIHPDKDQPKKQFKPPAKVTEAEEARKKAAGFKEYRDLKSQKKPEAKRSFDSRDRQGLRSGDDEEWRKRRNAKMRSLSQEEEIIRPKSLCVRLPITIKDLAAEMKLKSSQLISKLFMQGVVLTLNDFLDDETTLQLLGHEFECDITIDTREEEKLRITAKTIKQEIQESDSSNLIIRPPVVAFMGHVDHGKTSLIDAIRKSNRVAGEAGAITQHIGAFKCHTAVGDITILDTPGHEAFSAMRSRGADVTDIIVLVIAGDEGIRAQTLEAMNQAKEAKVPIIVVLNKSDKPNFNAENIYRQLSEHELLPEVWGGSTITVNCSAVTGAGIKELLEMLALQAEVLEIRANPKARARGTVIESEMHKGLGSVATILVQNGTLKLGDALVFGHHWARIKTMHDEYGKELLQAGPSSPVKITGLSSLPEAGSEFIVVKDEKQARELAHGRTEGHKNQLLQQAKRGPLEGLLQKNADLKEKKILTLILRADVQGSLEALKTSLLKIPSTKVDLAIISLGVGEISESDIQLAAASKATIIGFHTKVEGHAESLIKQNKVTVKLHDIIYHAVDDVKELMRSLLDKIPQENDTGKALVKAVFKASQLGAIAGCQVIEGTIKRNHHVRLMRKDQVVWKGTIASLKRVKEDVREVSKGIECGILLQNFNDVKEEDIIQAYDITYLEQEL